MIMVKCLWYHSAGYFCVNHVILIITCFHFSCRKLCCVGEKGLLTKILETLIRCPTTAPLR